MNSRFQIVPYFLLHRVYFGEYVDYELFGAHQPIMFMGECIRIHNELVVFRYYEVLCEVFFGTALTN